MRHSIKASLVLLLLMTGVGVAAAQSSGNQPKASNMETDVTNIKQALLGHWEKHRDGSAAERGQKCRTAR